MTLALAVIMMEVSAPTTCTHAPFVTPCLRALHFAWHSQINIQSGSQAGVSGQEPAP